MKMSISLSFVGLCLTAVPLCADEVPAKIADFVAEHCLTCHSGDSAERGLDLDSLTFDLNDTAVHDKWVRALDRVQRGEMPPKKGRVDQSEVDEYFNALHPLLFRAEQTRNAAEGRSTVRRLSRAEHINALRDLLKMPLLESGEKLPPDPLSDGFGKSSSTLPFSHVQVDRYLEVADDALRAAMAPQHQKPRAKSVRVWVADIRGKTFKQSYGNGDRQETLILNKQSTYLYGSLKNGGGMPLVGRKVDETFENWPGDFSQQKPGYVLDSAPFMDAVGILGNGDDVIGKDFQATAAGRYKLRVGAFAYRANKGRVEKTDRTEVVAFYSDDRLLGTVDVTPEAKVHEIEIWLRAGEPIRVTAASLPLWRIEIGVKGKRYPAVDVPAVAFQGFELEGPFIEQWPPASHERLFGDLPMQPRDRKQGDANSTLDYDVVSENPSADARQLLSSFISAAYRRDVTPDDFIIPMGMFEGRLKDGASFQDAMISAYSAVLSSPGFALVTMHAGALPPNELANRLSLFLWNSPADEALRESSTNEIVNDPDQYAAFVDRMLADPRSDRFVEHFLDHWLALRNIGVTEPDENLYSGYSTWLLESMLMETRSYFKELIREDLPVRSIIDSDFLMVNGALAELYGIEGPAGAQVQRVAIADDSIRGGLLTQASVLKVSANGTTTSPVVRGVFVMDRLLGDPPPPPPEAVPAVEPDLSGVTTIREQLAQHRADASCASCHRKIDPPGFALESFDVMGRYRERYHSLMQGEPVEGLNRRAKPIRYKLALPVDSSGQMEDGLGFDDVNQFRELVLKDERAIARNMLERLVVYATGHPVGISDREHVEAILDQSATDGYGLRSMIHGLVQSPMFRKK